MVADFNERKKELIASYAKQEIIDAVIKIIDNHGLKELTMSKVAEKAGIAKGTLYLYFDHKEDLIESTIESSLEPHFIAQNEILDGDLPPDEKLEKIAGQHFYFFKKHKNYFRVLIFEHQRSRDPKKHFIDNRYQGLLKRVGEVIQDGIDKGFFKSFDPELLAVMFSEALVGVTLQIILGKNDRNMDEAQQAVIDVFFNGIKS